MVINRQMQLAAVQKQWGNSWKRTTQMKQLLVTTRRSSWLLKPCWRWGRTTFVRVQQACWRSSALIHWHLGRGSYGKPLDSSTPLVSWKAEHCDFVGVTIYIYIYIGFGPLYCDIVTIQRCFSAVTGLWNFDCATTFNYIHRIVSKTIVLSNCKKCY